MGILVMKVVVFVIQYMFMLHQIPMIWKRSAGEYQIGIADEDIIITSDRPVVIWSTKEDEQHNRPRAVAFPLTSRLLLYMFPEESVDPIARNCFVKLSEDQINDLYVNTAVSARNWIYSRNQLTTGQQGIIREARKRIGRKERAPGNR